MKRIYLTTLVVLTVVAYTMTARYQFFSPPSFVEKPLFWLLFFLTIPLLCIYKFAVVIWYNLCFIAQLKPLQGIGLRARIVVFFVGAFTGIIGFHLALMQFLLMQHGYNIVNSGYVANELIFVVIPLVMYLGYLYSQPDTSITNRFIGSLVSGVVRFLTTHFPNQKPLSGPYGLQQPAANTYMPDIEDDGNFGIRIMEIFLLSFSKSKGSYLLDIQGEQIFIKDTSALLRRWTAGAWFVEISRGVFVNMWHVTGWDSGNPKCLAVAMELPLASQLISSSSNVLNKEMLEVKYKCRNNVVQHFKNRDKLTLDGWDDYYDY